MAPALGDARTFYKLHAMLSADAEIAAMDARRKPPPLSAAEDDDQKSSGGYLANRALRSSGLEDVCCFEANAAWLQEQTSKGDVAQEPTRHAGSTDARPYVLGRPSRLRSLRSAGGVGVASLRAMEDVVPGVSPL